MHIPLFPPPWAEVFGEDEAGIFADFTVKGVRFPMRWIPPGSFMMGSPQSEQGRGAGEDLQVVEIPHGFWIGQTPVTQKQWRASVGTNPGSFQDIDDDRPVEGISWDDCTFFLQKLNDQYPEMAPRLPTEAEWEYACRANVGGAYYDGSPCTVPAGTDPALSLLGWYCMNGSAWTQPVKKLLPNLWGLYDMLGNVYEWCEDRWEDSKIPVRLDHDPSEQARFERGEELHVCRGGSWLSIPADCRCACRKAALQASRMNITGMRVAISHSTIERDLKGS